MAWHSWRYNNLRYPSGYRLVFWINSADDIPQCQSWTIQPHSSWSTSTSSTIDVFRRHDVLPWLSSNYLTKERCLLVLNVSYNFLLPLASYMESLLVACCPWYSRHSSQKPHLLPPSFFRVTYGPFLVVITDLALITMYRSLMPSA